MKENTEKMKIFYNPEPFVSGESGIPVYAKNLIKNLLSLDPAIQLFSGAKTINPQFYYRIKTSLGQNDDFHFHIRCRFYPSFWKAPPLLSRFLDFREDDYDVIHMLGNYIAPSCWFSSFEKLILTIHDVYLFHPDIIQNDPVPHKDYILKVQKDDAHRAKKIITDSEFSKRDIHKFLDVPVDKIQVIPIATQWVDDSKVPVDKSFFDEYSIEPGKFFLSVGAIKRNKNYETLLDGFEKYRSSKEYRNEKLVIVGPAFNLTLGETIRHFSDVILLENVSSESLKMLYQNAKGFFLLSLIEGFGIPLLEAMQQGTPSCYARGTATDEIGRDAAFSIEDPKDSDAVAEMFGRFSAGGQEITASVEECRKIASEYNWQNTARKTLELYRSI